MADIDVRTLSESIERFGYDLDLVHAWAQGGAGETVTINGTETPTILNLVTQFINGGGVVAYQTKALLNADLAHDANTLAFVSNDSTAGNLGWYIKVGASGSGSWKQSTYDRTVTQAQLASFLHGAGVLANNTDFDTLGNMTAYVVPSSATGLIHSPAGNTAGIVLTFGRDGSNSVGKMQVYVSYAGASYWRIKWNYWTEWAETASAADIESCLHGDGILTTSTIDAVCDADINNIITPTMYAVDPAVAADASLHNLPSTQGGLLITYARNGITSDTTTSNVQEYCDYAGRTFTRISTANAAYSGWREVQYIDKSLKIVALGDSICAGTRNGGKGFVGDLGYEYVNLGKNGWALSTIRGDDPASYAPIYRQLESANFPAWTPDVFLIDGGTNDYRVNWDLVPGANEPAPLGTVPTEPVDSSELGTAIGGLQHLLYLLRTNYPYAQKYFILAHKSYDRISSNQAYWHYSPTDSNTQGYNMAELNEAIVKTCRVFGVQVIDVFNGSMMDTYCGAYCSATNYTSSNLPPSTETAWCNYDGIHPLAQGYLHAYVPLIKAALQTATK